VALSLSQTVPVAGAVLVTTPQTVALVEAAVRVAQQISIASFARRSIPLTPVS
jgi:hypothetical protein